MSDDLERITSEQVSAKDEQIARLEGDLQNEKDSRNQERFVFSLAILLLIDMISLRDMSVNGTIAIVLFEIILLTVLARLFAVDGIYVIIQNSIDMIYRGRSGRGNGDGQND